MARYTLKKGDTKPARFRLVREDGGPVHLGEPPAQSVVRIRMVHAVTGVVVLNNLPCDVIDERGVVEYSWAVGQTDVRGVYRVTFPITDAAGDVETVPNHGALDLVIE